MKLARVVAALCFWMFAISIAAGQSEKLRPEWKPGEKAIYLVQVKNNREVRTRGPIALPDTPAQAKFETRGLLLVEVLERRSQGATAAYRLRTKFVTLDSQIGAIRKGQKPNDGEVQRVVPEDKTVECTLQLDGQITEIAGLENLQMEQQEAWREWAARFAAVFVLPKSTLKRGEKWNAEEPENAPSPIAKLHWLRKSQYVQDEPCAPVQISLKGESQRSAHSDTCAVILTTATLVQKSSPKDATPPDYKVRGLHTRGTAKGSNETILYISRKTGMLVRSTQDAQQEMDVFIVLADGSNQVHYSVSAKGSSTVELVSDTPLNLKNNRTN